MQKDEYSGICSYNPSNGTMGNGGGSLDVHWSDSQAYLPKFKANERLSLPQNIKVPDEEHLRLPSDLHVYYTHTHSHIETYT